ncbi:MAG: tyrosine-type recombinase/integrase [Firmicutes bacterium]|nr:tyrosine-type recombinase/integrase [Bacillota bacterium]
MRITKDRPLTSVLAPILADLIAEKRGVGYHYIKEAEAYARFDQFCAAVGHRSLTLPRELVDAWTAKQPHETEANRQGRISRMRVLGQYMQRRGYLAWVYPSHRTGAPVPAYQPYIFSFAELAALWRAVDACETDVNSPYRSRVLPVLFRVLYGAGLRVAEALALRQSDFDPLVGTLHVRTAKLDKERRIPLHPMLAARVTRYLDALVWLRPLGGPLFPNPHGEPYAVSTVYRYFRRFLWQAGISHQGRGHGPRLHDLRHTFAVHCLRQWVLDGVDLTVALPYLSTYMGHVGLKSTQGYLRLTADLYPTVVRTVEQRFGAIIPAGGAEE